MEIYELTNAKIRENLKKYNNFYVLQFKVQLKQDILRKLPHLIVI